MSQFYYYPIAMNNWLYFSATVQVRAWLCLCTARCIPAHYAFEILCSKPRQADVEHRRASACIGAVRHRHEQDDEHRHQRQRDHVHDERRPRRSASAGLSRHLLANLDGDLRTGQQRVVDHSPCQRCDNLQGGVPTSPHVLTHGRSNHHPVLMATRPESHRLPLWGWRASGVPVHGVTLRCLCREVHGDHLRILPCC